MVEEQVTYVNAPHLAADRGIEVTLSTLPKRWRSPAWSPSRGPGRWSGRVGVRYAGAGGPGQAHRTRRLPAGTGADGILLFFLRYSDRPGVVGTIGSLLGAADVNIAAMQVARREAGGEALMTLTVDHKVEPVLLAQAAEAIGATAASVVDLTD